MSWHDKLYTLTAVAAVCAQYISAFLRYARPLPCTPRQALCTYPRTHTHRADDIRSQWPMTFIHYCVSVAQHFRYGTQK
jgi:hypothetical protein